MTTFLIYSLQTIVLQVLFLAVFEILFKKETFFKANRFYLLSSLILSLLLPLIQIPVEAGEFNNLMQQMIFFYLC